MEENFDPVARTRANYYTPGSPVQFVCVELLKGEASGDHAVCLTFKNISRVTLTALEIHFKCKGVDGVILCEDQFEYRDIEVKPGESFGMDDAVFVTQKAITSVDVSLRNVYSGKKVVHLDAIKRVRLPAPRRLSPELQKSLEARMNRQGLKYMPQVFENGWYCACGSFHPEGRRHRLLHGVRLRPYPVAKRIEHPAAAGKEGACARRRAGAACADGAGRAHPRCGCCPGPAGRADPHRGQCAAPDRTGCGGHPRDAAAHDPAAFG